MSIKRWRKRTERTEVKITGRELGFLLMELETESLDNEVYRYRIECGIKVVYYMYDLQLLEKYIYKPIYLYNQDIYFLEEPEEILFQKILMNTVKLFRTKIIPFYEYLEELEKGCEEAYISIIRRITGVMRRVRSDRQLWCLTNNLEERGASGVFYKPLLRKFCEEKGYDALVVGVMNNDYALLAQKNINTIFAIKELTYGTGNLRRGSEKIIEKRVLLYDYKENILKILDKDSE